MVTITRVGTTQDRLGESPVWSAREQRLHWLDSLAGTLHRLDPASGAREDFAVPAPAGSFGLCEDGGAVLALAEGFARYDFTTRRATPLARLPAPHPELRLNDGKVDREGRFLAGTMHMGLAPGAAPLGGLYRLERDGTLTILADDIVTTNGPCFSPDGRWLYCADSARRVIWRFAYGAAPLRRERFIDLEALGTAPDGATVDARGHLWVALVRTGELGEFDAEGRLLRRIALPVKHPTSVNFGGPRLDVLYLTSISASHRLHDDSEGAGGLFAITGLGAPGLAEPLVRR